MSTKMQQLTGKKTSSSLDSRKLFFILWFVVERKLNSFAATGKNPSGVANVRSDDLLRLVLNKKGLERVMKRGVKVH